MEHFSEDTFPSDGTSINIPQRSKSNFWGPNSNSGYRGSSDASLFSSSLPVLPHEKLTPLEFENGVQSIDNVSTELNELAKHAESKDPDDELDVHGIGICLPDDDELFTGMTYDFGPTVPSQVEETEEYDIFGSGGGMELDLDSGESLSYSMANASISDDYVGNLSGHYGIPNGSGTVAGEHPLGEHPSRTLFVRNINSNVEDSELRLLFEQYGAIRSLYTACKHRGFVMISYYDIRDARNAMRALQNKPLRRRKLDIHFSIPKENPSEKDINQGTLVVFNLDPSVSNEDLRQIFGAYGEVKEIRETPHKRHHKFIEFYDVRAAEAALRALNRSDIAGKRIKLEPSRPGGARRNLIQHLNQDLEQDETRNFRHQVGSPIANSPPGIWAQFSSPRDNGLYGTHGQSPTIGAYNHMANNHLPGLASILPSSISKPAKVTPIGKDQNRAVGDPLLCEVNNQNGISYQHSHSFPEHNAGIIGNISSSPRTLSSMGTLNGPQFLWGSSAPFSDRSQTSVLPGQSMGHSFAGNNRLGHVLPYPNRHGTYLGSSSHHIGSAPPIIPFERRYGFFPDSQETSLMSQPAFGCGGSNRSGGDLLMNMGVRVPQHSGITFAGNVPESSMPGLRLAPSQNMGLMFFGSPPYPGNGIESFVERGRSRRVDNNSSQFQLDLEKIENGQDTRTTLMIKNIPNKYTSKMLLAAIDENHMGTYDFFYLPIDFKNKCNMGYAFINMVSPSHIIPFYQTFNGKKWEKFNSEKVASLAYARIQGKDALVVHFQNSSLMNEDKRCRPILFPSEEIETVDQELFRNNGSNMHIQDQVQPSLGDPPESLTKIP